LRPVDARYQPRVLEILLDLKLDLGTLGVVLATTGGDIANVIATALGAKLARPGTGPVPQPASRTTAEVFWRNAVTGWNRGEWRSAELSARRAISLDPGYGPAYAQLAAEYQRQFRRDLNAALHDSAVASIEKAVALSPDH
jgi:hypothetical protein